MSADLLPLLVQPQGMHGSLVSAAEQGNNQVPRDHSLVDPAKSTQGMWDILTEEAKLG